MDFTGRLIGTFHQTRVSRAMKDSPLTGGIMRKWWWRQQSRRFATGMQRLGPALVPSSTDAPLGEVEVPTVQEILEKLPRLIITGEAFSHEMGQWCVTSKFSSITQDPGSCGYQDVYASILRHLRNRRNRVLEIGIGVNDPDARSGMEVDHQPGSSLRGWSGYFPGSEIHGADIDKRCLIDTSEYQTHQVDQRDGASLAKLAVQLRPGFDLIVDDGLHTPEANANTVAALLPLLKPSGVMVVEDIQPTFDSLWLDLADNIRPEYSCVYFPSHVLRQNRSPGSSGGLAVLTRNC